MTQDVVPNLKNADIEEIITFCAQYLNEKKALDVLSLDLTSVNSYFSHFMIATGNSFIHCRSLARELRNKLLSAGLKEVTRPDLTSEWIILDFDPLVVHIFTENKRVFYQLEKLWGDAPVRFFR